MMKIIYEKEVLKKPIASIILLDWSVRESFHILDYLNSQTALRDKFEIIWIEYYDRKPKEIREKLDNSLKKGRAIIDKWIVMEMPKNVYYHKHLMYNSGIITAQGKIVTFCDSDAIIRPTFIESIIKSFEKDNDIVLHMDEVRNKNRKFYPFCYPSINEITGEGCVNWLNSKPIGLVDRSDPLHLRNYGACMSALRKDLIEIGGADEHIDYLGHISGPYEITFRLINAGKKEVWHQGEWLYHTWHPGQGGKGNYSGPTDGCSMSSTALFIRSSDRIKPLVENQAIRVLRLKEKVGETPLLLAISKERIEDWAVVKLKQCTRKTSLNLVYFIHYPTAYIKLYRILLKMVASQFYGKICQLYGKDKRKISPEVGLVLKMTSSPIKDMEKEKKSIIKRILRKVRSTFGFIRFLFRYNRLIINRCQQCIHNLASDDTRNVALFGIGNMAEVIYILAKENNIKVNGIYDNFEGRRFLGFDVFPLEGLKEYKSKVIISSLSNIREKTKRLKRMGIGQERIVYL